MITRPLDLASRLRTDPRSLDWLFYVSGGLIVLFFYLFGSQFILSPGLGVSFELPQVQGANAGAQTTTHVITVVSAGQILAGDGMRTADQLQDWLNAQAKTVKKPSLLIRASKNVPAGILARIFGMAHAAGFNVVFAAEEQSSAAENGARH